MKNFKILTFIVLIAGFYLLSMNLFSQTQSFTLVDAIKTAIKNNSETKSSLLEVKRAQAAVDEAFGYALPTVNLSGSYFHFLEKQKMPFPDFESLLNNMTYKILEEEKIVQNPKYLPMKYSLQSFALSNNYEAKIEVNQILFNSAVFNGIGASATYLKTSQKMLYSNISKTVKSVKESFYGALLAKEMLKITEESLENFERNLNNIRAMNKQGLASDFNLMQAEVQLENFKPIVINAKNGYKTALDGLKIVMGIATDTEIDLIGNLEIEKLENYEANQLIEKSLEKNFDILTLKNKIEVDEAFIDLDRSEYYPSLVAFGNYSFNGASDNFDFINYRQSLIGLSFQINLFNGNRTNKKVQQSTIKKMQTEEQLVALKNAIKLQIRMKVNEIEKVKTTLEAQQRNVDLAQKAFEIANIQLKEGTGTQLELINAEFQLRQSKINKLQSQYEYLKAVAELDNLTGNLKQEYYELAIENNK